MGPADVELFMNSVLLNETMKELKMKVELTHFHHVVPACSAETEKVFKLSSEENLQPFKDNMETFLSQGETLMTSFQDVSNLVMWPVRSNRPGHSSAGPGPAASALMVCLSGSFDARSCITG